MARSTMRGLPATKKVLGLGAVLLGLSACSSAPQVGSAASQNVRSIASPAPTTVQTSATSGLTRTVAQPPLAADGNSSSSHVTPDTATPSPYLVPSGCMPIVIDVHDQQIDVVGCDGRVHQPVTVITVGTGALLTFVTHSYPRARYASSSSSVVVPMSSTSFRAARAGRAELTITSNPHFPHATLLAVIDVR